MDRREMAVAGRKAREAKRILWPAEVKDRGKFVFARPHSLRHDGKTYSVEIRSCSRKGHQGVWMLVNGQVFPGKSEREAWAALIRGIDPEVEEVRL